MLSVGLCPSANVNLKTYKRSSQKEKRMAIFLNTYDEMNWLASVHLGDLAINWQPRAAVLHGREDCPNAIDLYPRHQPRSTDVPLTGILIDDKYEFCGPLTADVAHLIDIKERRREGTTRPMRHKNTL